MARQGRGYPIQPKRFRAAKPRGVTTVEVTASLEASVDPTIVGSKSTDATVSLSATTEITAVQEAYTTHLATASLSVEATTTSDSAKTTSANASLSADVTSSTSRTDERNATASLSANVTSTATSVVTGIKTATAEATTSPVLTADATFVPVDPTTPFSQESVINEEASGDTEENWVTPESPDGTGWIKLDIYPRDDNWYSVDWGAPRALGMGSAYFIIAAPYQYTTLDYQSRIAVGFKQYLKSGTSFSAVGDWVTPWSEDDGGDADYRLYPLNGVGIYGTWEWTEFDGFILHESSGCGVFLQTLKQVGDLDEEYKIFTVKATDTGVEVVDIHTIKCPNGATLESSVLFRLSEHSDEFVIFRSGGWPDANAPDGWGYWEGIFVYHIRISEDGMITHYDTSKCFDWDYGDGVNFPSAKNLDEDTLEVSGTTWNGKMWIEITDSSARITRQLWWDDYYAYLAAGREGEPTDMVGSPEQSWIDGKSANIFTSMNTGVQWVDGYWHVAEFGTWSAVRIASGMEHHRIIGTGKDVIDWRSKKNVAVSSEWGYSSSDIGYSETNFPDLKKEGTEWFLSPYQSTWTHHVTVDGKLVGYVTPRIMTGPWQVEVPDWYPRVKRDFYESCVVFVDGLNRPKVLRMDFLFADLVSDFTEWQTLMVPYPSDIIALPHSPVLIGVSPHWTEYWQDEDGELGADPDHQGRLWVCIIPFGEAPPLKLSQRDDDKVAGAQRIGYQSQNSGAIRAGWISW